MFLTKASWGHFLDTVNYYLNYSILIRKSFWIWEVILAPTLDPDCLDSNVRFEFSHYFTLDKLLKLSVPQFPQWENRDEDDDDDRNSIHLVGLLGRLNCHIKYVKKSLIYSRCHKSASWYLYFPFCCIGAKK
jgi:hypothetical protein